MKLERRKFLSVLGTAMGTQLLDRKLAFGLGHGKMASTDSSNTPWSQVDEIFAADFAKFNVASLTVGVIRGTQLAWSKSYGMANMEQGVAATPETIYRIGSITKQFTATAFLQLVQKGKVRLTDPVEMYVPEISQIKDPPARTPPITLIQLATHTSGLDREPDPIEVYTAGQVKDWQHTLLASLPHLKYAFEPGTKQVYSNMGFAILGLALERACGQPYIHYVTQNILEPLGMTTTSFEQTSAMLPRLAMGYGAYTKPVGKLDSSVMSQELKNGRGYKVPNGALFTTLADLCKFVVFEMGNGPDSVLDKSVLADNQTRLYGADTTLKRGIGIGFFVERLADVELTGHGGQVAGFTAGAYFNRQQEIGIVWLRSLYTGVPLSSVFKVAAAVA
jgi:CubicO group peptidase (beta-lactamase class C family)